MRIPNGVASASQFLKYIFSTECSQTNVMIIKAVL